MHLVETRRKFDPMHVEKYLYHVILVETFFLMEWNLTYVFITYVQM
jgi:hypothetical protein